MRLIVERWNGKKKEIQAVPRRKNNLIYGGAEGVSTGSCEHALERTENGKKKKKKCWKCRLSTACTPSRPILPENQDMEVYKAAFLPPNLHHRNK